MGIIFISSLNTQNNIVIVIFSGESMATSGVNIDISIEHGQLKSFGLTHFQYQQGDHIGLVLAFSSLIPIFLIVVETTIVLSRREIIGITFLLGQLLNEAFNLALKLAIRESRPNPHLGDGYGMPSSHSQFMGFFAVYVCMYLQNRVTTDTVQKLAVQIGALALSALTVISRVYLGYHTVLQVFAGTAVGLAAGYAWYQLIELVVYPSGIVSYALDSSVCKWLLIRDSRDIKDIVQAEYELTRAARNKRTE
ncbi:hypothetical protein LPJ53_000722 [Coemansia erecta]|uniref:Dolichyldiphosphatase n=1 Tax=Coemansia erecta TaxID=147472 RepID=A0A9W7Y1E1_9FUNG|nr:hypothetical protein LPJ53_000722 [Coemansia erecta]